VDDLTIRSVVPGGFIPDIGSLSEKPNVSAIPSTGDATTSFKDTVKSLLSDVNDKLQISDTNMQDLATGRTNDLQKVVTSVEEANLALQYTMAVRTKLLDAYQEISRMQL
jgi:flagellar hook-basal body complex protein FliE